MRSKFGGHSYGLVAAVLILSGCTALGPDYLKPAAPVPAHYKEINGWKLGEPQETIIQQNWWQAFDDAELNSLEPQVSIHNQTLKVDEANYREALALIAESRASLFPTLGLDGTAQHSGTGLGGAGSTSSSTVSLNGNAAWVPDLWGQVRRQIESKDAAAEMSAAQLAAARLSMQSALATAYFQLRSADALHDLLGDVVKDYQRSLTIAQNQYKAGTAARANVIQAQSLVLSAQAQQINSQVARQQAEHAIAVLVGRPPSELSIGHAPLKYMAPHVPVSVPSTLLERRPDIVAAERNMKAQNALIGVAMAAYYPNISLSGLLGVSSVGSQLSFNPVWSIGASLSQMLFNGGLTDAQVAAARACYDASVASYRQTVLTAFQQVEDQLSALRILGQEASVQDNAVKLATQAAGIAINEYDAGTQNFTTVVTAEASAISARENALTIRQQRYLATVSLIVALGGGWNGSVAPPTP
jgi:NodT family efflux transporter outer membrane factor (OMF) lipoprotein